MQLLQDADDGLDHYSLLQGRRVAAIDISPAADDHRRALLDRFQVEGPAILQSIVRRLQGHEVIRLAAIHGVGHNAETKRIELRELAQEATALAVRAIVGLGVRLVEQLGFPLRRSVGDGIYLVQDVFPVTLEVRRGGKHAGHADDGDVFRSGGGGLLHVKLNF